MSINAFTQTSARKPATPLEGMVFLAIMQTWSGIVPTRSPALQLPRP